MLCDETNELRIEKNESIFCLLLRGMEIEMTCREGIEKVEENFGVFCNIYYPSVDRYLEQVLNFTSQQDGSKVLNSSSDVNRIIAGIHLSVT